VRAAVVVCPSVHVELQENYRQEVLLARAFAANGLAVLRFHYRGTGHSDGDDEAATLDSMIDDAASAADRVMQATAAGRVAFLGTRWGGLVAAGAATRLGAAPVALFDPVLEPDRYFREAIRAQLIHRMKEGGAGPPSHEALLGELRTSGFLDILGYPLHAGLYHGARGRGIRDLLGDRNRPVLLVHFNRNGTLRADYANLADELRTKSFPVDVKVIREQPAWWFSRRVLRTIDALGEATAQWLVARLAGEGGA
jgi:pimeloyl-ACP methyl ester carboxylesterase